MSDPSDPSDAPRPDRLLPKHGGYRILRSFQTAQAVYDGTIVFCDRFIERRSRTHDQMVQAARIGMQNVAEGSVASGTSKKTELKLTNVARAGLEELLLDYQDFLRQRRLRLWAKDSPEALSVRRLYQSGSPDVSGQSDPYRIRTASPEAAANTLICLINQASFLLTRQLRNLEQSFLEHGGFTERLCAARVASRMPSPDQSDSSDGAPACPVCGRPTVRRVAKNGPHAGGRFWGCPSYPDCTGTRPG